MILQSYNWETGLPYQLDPSTTYLVVWTGILPEGIFQSSLNPVGTTQNTLILHSTNNLASYQTTSEGFSVNTETFSNAIVQVQTHFSPVISNVRTVNTKLVSAMSEVTFMNPYAFPCIYDPGSVMAGNYAEGYSGMTPWIFELETGDPMFIPTVTFTQSGPVADGIFSQFTGGPTNENYTVIPATNNTWPNDAMAHANVLTSSLGQKQSFTFDLQGPNTIGTAALMLTDSPGADQYTTSYFHTGALQSPDTAPTTSLNNHGETELGQVLDTTTINAPTIQIVLQDTL